MTKKDNAVPIDKDFEHMMISAVRYAFGRRTYIVLTTIEYVGLLIPKLSDWCLNVLQKDFESEKELAERANIWRTFGDPCDRVRWFKFYEALVAESKKRVSESAVKSN